jgi:hypothetical protein
MLALGLAAILAVSSTQTAAPQRPAPGVKMRSPERLPSLVSGETLGAGGSALLATAGFPTLGVAWAQGVTPTLDAGAALELDVALSELFVGPTVRVGLARRGATAIAFSARAGYYADLGADWVVSRNRANDGVQLAPGIAMSTRSPAGGLVTAAFELPITATIRHGGTVVMPRFSASYEAPLYGDLSIGARVGASVRAASGGAPLADRDARFAVSLGALLTYRIF